jgi:prepilin-type N-terminal cleavage/methylation domain-containing protein
MDGCSNALRSQRGFTLVELLVAVVLLSVGVAATIGALSASGRSTLRAQRVDVGVEKAQAEIDKLASLKYGEIALTAAPATSTDPNNPDSRVTGTTFRVKAGLNEQFVLTPDTGLTAKVNPGPQSFAVGSGGSAVTGKVYRFVTWRDEGSCADSSNALCTSNQDTKRVTVAITLDPTTTQAARSPIWISSVIADKDATPPGSTAAPPTTPTVTAQSFYLYDTPCGQTDPQPQTGSHPTRDTAAFGATAAADSICENGDASKQPDLLTPSLPAGPDSETPPLYDYSSDLSGDRPGGLAMVHQGTTCSTSYPAAGSTGALNKLNLHAWSTNAFADSFHLNGQVTLSLFATTIGGASGRGAVCASLVDRQVSSGVPQDHLLGSFLYDISTWPSTPRRLTFTFNLSPAQDVAAGHRLVLVLHARGESDNDLVFLYDHPLYQSLLEVATSTPLTPQ